MTSGEVKRSNIIKVQLQSQIQGHLYQTLCVFSQIKDIKRSTVIVILSHGSCPMGWDLEVLVGQNL